MKSLSGALLACVSLLLCFGCFFGVSAQIVGPDDAGNRFFFFNNYTSVFVLRELKPSIEFHPVLGGSDNTYIRYENWAAFNFTNLQEYGTDGTVVAQIDPMSLTWKLTNSSDTDSQTGNFHSIATIAADAPNGAHVEVICESWSKGLSRPYGPYLNNISADQTEISLSISKWPFKSMANTFHATMLLSIDSFKLLPTVTSPTSYQRTVTITSPSITFTATLMTEGFLDGQITHFTYDKQPYGFTGAYFILISKAFNNTYFYDPNFSVLLDTKPDCSKLSNCGHGTCVEDNRCQCKRFYVQPDCVTFNATATSSDENPPPLESGGGSQANKHNKVSTPVIIGVSVGACVGAAAIMAVILSVRHHSRSVRMRKMTMALERPNN
eukprot:Phypoly_transcript_09574.p1 GENE.Phypoly_transcript_09574~~Phypoly_transcript_09574.p1  ORF type:complete len:381 (+),score=57.63 Phypoly_transcript_09574:91-1233(+)